MSKYKIKFTAENETLHGGGPIDIFVEVVVDDFEDAGRIAEDREPNDFVMRDEFGNRIDDGLELANVQPMSIEHIEEEE